jgi:hypothetical protein
MDIIDSPESDNKYMFFTVRHTPKKILHVDDSIQIEIWTYWSSAGLTQDTGIRTSSMVEGPSQV